MDALEEDDAGGYEAGHSLKFNTLTRFVIHDLCIKRHDGY